MMEQVESQQRASAAIWNPNAAANWSLIFSPAFGAYLHMINWRALGEAELAAKSRTWFIVALGLLGLYLALGLFLPDSKAVDGATRGIGFVFLFSWYFGSARAQARYVKSKYGATYERRPWGKALGLAVAAMLGYFVLAALVAVVVGVVTQ